jgi:hypothetical protein
VIAAALALSVLLGGCASAPVVPAPTPTVAPAVTAQGRQRVEVTFTGGAVRGGVVRYGIPKGSAVELVVSSDVADQVHVHGYDRLSYVTAGASTTLRFTADLPGVFDVELEQRGAPLAQLQVS